MTAEREPSTHPLFFTIAGAAFFVALMIGIFLWAAKKDPQVGGNFELTYRGEPWTFSDHAKKLNVLYIGYAKCPDVCPMSLSFASQAFKQLKPDERSNVQFFFLSVDRDNDKPEDVAEYAAQFDPAFVGLSGSREQIDKAVSLFHASYIVEKDEKSYLGYTIAHTDKLFFLDKKGVRQAQIATPRSVDLILQTIKENL